MRVRFLLFCAFSFCSAALHAQQGEWVWINGDSTAGSAGNYGTQGVASPGNYPTGMYEPCKWTDTSGNFWLYGGFDNNGDYLNDLWMYDPVVNEWTWVNGTHTVNDAGSYGTQGMPSPSNRPPSRALAPVGWVDDSNNLWMFGGGNTNLEIYNDLWKYDIAANEWTWMKGSSVPGATGVYGVKGTANIANTPGAREETAAAWTDNNGDLWFLGGFNGGTYNDLWRFNIASNSWTWMKGSSTPGAAVIYGVKGVESATSTPGGVWAYSSWKDGGGNLWFWGGVGNDSNNVDGGLNDMWRYNPATNNWTWMNGDATASTNSRFGIKCDSSQTNTPGGRYENRAAWTDANGNFWMFGGLTDPHFYVLNDLWMYCVLQNEWIWVSGDSTFNPKGFWGIKNVASPYNKPSGRAGAVGWSDKSGHLYLFGGEFNQTNDLWKYTIANGCSSCSFAFPVAAFESSDSTPCANDCLNFTDLSSNATSWQWSFAGGMPSSSTLQNPQNICYTASGNYNVTLIVSNSGGSDTLTINNFISVHPSPPAPVIYQSNDTLFCKTDTSFSSYQWYDSTTVIAGATDTFLVVTQNGNYNLRVKNSNGCVTATGINISVGLNEPVTGLRFSLSPNPAIDWLTLTASSMVDVQRSVLYICNILGEIVYTKEIGNKQEVINCKAFQSGIYIIKIEDEKARWISKFVKQ